MLSSIHPLGERARSNRFAFTATAHLLGAAVGGVSLGLVAGVAGQLAGLDATPGWVVAAVVAAAVVLDVVGVSVPSSHRQVNERWIDTYRGVIYGAGFGFQLGVGVMTVITSWLVPAVVVLAALTGSWWGGVVVGSAFGVVRGAIVWTVAGVDSVDRLQRYHRRLHERYRTVRALTLTAVAVGALAAGVWA